MRPTKGGRPYLALALPLSLSLPLALALPLSLTPLAPLDLVILLELPCPSAI